MVESCTDGRAEVMTGIKFDAITENFTETPLAGDFLWDFVSFETFVKPVGYFFIGMAITYECRIALVRRFGRWTSRCHRARDFQLIALKKLYRQSLTASSNAPPIVGPSKFGAS